MRVSELARRSLRAVEREGRSAWRRRMLRHGLDGTKRSGHASCLVLAPHPDDETIGCGATIARKRAASTPVRVLVAADGRSSHSSLVIGPDELAQRRSLEVVAACRVLGVDEADVVQLGLEDDSLAGNQQRLAEAIVDILDAMAPEEVRVPSGRDWHPDHRALRRALDLALEGRSSAPRVLEYPVWFWMHGPWEADAGGPWASLRPRALVGGLLDRGAWPNAELVSTSGFLGQKLSALHCHKSQLTNLTGESGWAVLDSTFLSSFLLPHEVAFPVGGSSQRAVMRVRAARPPVGP